MGGLFSRDSREKVEVMGKWCERIPMVLGMWGCVLTTAWGASSSQSEVGAAIQAIEQAPDPSATVAAYINGAAVDHNDPKLSEAYVVSPGSNVDHSRVQQRPGVGRHSVRRGAPRQYA